MDCYGKSVELNDANYAAIDCTYCIHYNIYINVCLSQSSNGYIYIYNKRSKLLHYYRSYLIQLLNMTISAV